ncbi:lipopolysaccharide assembly protein LapA domain-containing protein [Rhodococcus rhodochrous]|uniref:lipopolysaccharide assembly protein LapA domain-containing protein n=1 Tax=Rhodococcus rhodochrous TaxID=1829 RepID=UPI0020B14B4C|nr:lipopolysaccharide assembly protein LapA domain-containing protein [Rhodococcus rhodochrous]
MRTHTSHWGRRSGDVDPSPADPAHHTGVVEPTRTGRMLVALAIGAVVTVVLLVFILQHTERTAIAFLGWDFTLPLGVALLFAALAGLLIAAVIGGARIWQLRHAYRKAQ